MSTLDSLLLAYDVTDDQYVGNQDPLLANMKVEIDVKTEFDESSDEVLKKKKKKSSSERKSKRGRPKKQGKTSKSGKTKSKKVKKDSKDRVKKKKKFKNRKTVIIRRMPKQLQLLPEVKEAVYSTLLCGSEGSLGNMRYKNVEICRDGYDKGYSTKDEDLNKFREEKDGVVNYKCEDCDYSTLYKSAFKTHFIMHANVYFMVVSINKTISTYYCHLCEKPCKSSEGLDQHLREHRDKVTEKRNKPIKVEKKEQEEEEEEDDDDNASDNEKLINLKKSPKWEIEDNFVDANSAFDEPDDSFFDDCDRNESDNESKYDPKSNDDIVISGFVKLDVDFDVPIADEKATADEDDTKDEVVVKKEIEEFSDEKPDFPKVEERDDLCFVKVESEKEPGLPPGENKKCPYCNYEAKLFPLSQHRCKAVRQCDICSKVLLTQRVFRYHRKSHFCDKCPFKSVDLKEVTKHKKESLECWSKCANCDFMTMSQESYERHVRTKTCFRDRNVKMEKSNYFFYCDLCSYRTFYKEILEKHISKHNSCRASAKDSFLCDICQKACFSRITLLSHYKAHFCGKCDYMSNFTRDILKHRKANPDCLFKCDNCEFATSHKISLTRHRKHSCGRNNHPSTSEDADKNPGKNSKRARLSKTLSCDSCAYRTNSKSFLEMHIKKHQDPKPYHCSTCDFKCSQKGNLLIHEKKHIQGKSYCCTLCNYQCSRFKVFQMHKKTHGLDENSFGEPVKESNRDPNFLYCEKCEFRTKYPQYLRNHAMKHENIRPHLCPYCGITFYSLIDYHVHKKNAHNTEPQKLYKCSYCDYSYSKKATVLIHERKHTGVKPYKCEFCSYTTNYSGNLQAHRKKHLTMGAGTPHNSVPFAAD